MSAFYVSQFVSNCGIHAVHRRGCGGIPEPRKRLYLGEFATCEDALVEARRHFALVEGCPDCAPRCIPKKIPTPM